MLLKEIQTLGTMELAGINYGRRKDNADYWKVRKEHDKITMTFNNSARFSIISF